MPKARNVGTFEEALQIVVGADGLTVARCREITGKRAASIYAWTDPDRKGRPTLHDAFLLDCEYARTHKGAAPILDTYARKLHQVVPDGEIAFGSIVDEAMDVPVAVGLLVAAVQRAKSPTSPGGARITRGEAQQLLQEIARARRELDEMELAVRRSEAGGGEMS